jgi:hypothetical protein
MTVSEGRPWQRWGAAAVVFGLFVVGALIFVFAGTLTRAGELEREAEAARAEVAALEARLAAGQAELEFIKTDAFVRQQARAYAYGRRDETPFSLPADAPSPPPLRPLGSAGLETAAVTPLEAWLALLFGA